MLLSISLFFLSFATGLAFFVAVLATTSHRRDGLIETTDKLVAIVFTIFGCFAGCLTEAVWMTYYNVEVPLGSWILMLAGFLVPYVIICYRSETFREHHVPRFILNRLYGASTPLACV